MKRINGLADAMRVVESACEKGEITIIGEGAMPSAATLLYKAADFIHKEYGVDIRLIALVGDEPPVTYDNKPTVEPLCVCDMCECCYEDEEEDEEEDTILFDIDGIERYLNEAIPIAMPYLLAEYVDTLCYDIVSYCCNHNADDTVQNLNGVTVKKDIADIIYEALDAITRTECDRVGEILGENINNHYVLF